MSSPEKQIVREVLAAMVEEAPRPLSFDSLIDKRSAEEPDRSKRSALVPALAGFMLIVVALGSTIVITRSTSTEDGLRASGAAATIFMLPTAIPDGLDLFVAEVWSDGNATTQIYLPPGKSTYAEGDRVVNINVTDSVAMATAAGLDSDGEAQASTIFAEMREQLEIVYADSQLSFDLITVRGNPSMIVERFITLEGTTDRAIGVVVIEGDGIITEVDTHQLTRDVIIAIAESLEPVTSAAFDTYTDSASSMTRP